MGYAGCFLSRLANGIMRINLILACAFPVILWATEKKQPNIVVMIADDCRFMDLGCYGSPDAITPNIDRLAREGMRFQSFFRLRR